MRYAKCVLISGEEGLHPIDQRFAERPEITRELIHNIGLVKDETFVTLYQLTGDVQAVEAILEESTETLSYHISNTDDRIHLYLHAVGNDTVVDLLEMLREFEFIIDTPLEYTRRGGLRVTLVGHWDSFREAIPETPEDIRLKLLQTGDYEPNTNRLYSLLTPQQQEALEVAVDMGYYEVPRQATHEDIAGELGCTGGTVGGHLRKVEAKILSEIVP